jgi:RNA-binding protein
MLAGHQKVYLRGIGHRLSPAVHVGKSGLTPGVEAQVNHELALHELIKVRFHQHRDERHRLAAELAAATGSEVAGGIGNVVLLYKEHPDAEKRKIALPRRPRERSEGGAEAVVEEG